MNDTVTKIDRLIEDYKGSISDDNKRFVEGVIYGLNIAKAVISKEAHNG